MTLLTKRVNSKPFYYPMRSTLMSIETKLKNISDLLSSTEIVSAATKIDNKQNRAAATRVRKLLKQAMDDLKALRVDALEATRKED